jgi:predicted esterase
MEIKQNSLKVQRTAHYYTNGTLSENTREIFILLHGYGQHAADFLAEFNIISHETRFLAAPEGLSKFYHRNSSRNTGASWMTRHNRADEIMDYLAYLDQFAIHIYHKSGNEISLTLVGFSQGTETAVRWFCQCSIQFDKLIIWAGNIPCDIDLNGFKSRLSHTRLILVHGENDRFISSPTRNNIYQKLNDAGIQYEHLTFPGGHVIHRETLLKII